MAERPRPRRAPSEGAAGGARSTAQRRQAIRDLVVAGGLTGLRDLDERLSATGRAVGPDDLRADLRALGVVRVSGPDGPVLALPLDGGEPVGRTRRAAGSGRSGPERGPWPTITDDPDWKLQAVVVAVVLAFVLVGVLAWLVGR